MFGMNWFFVEFRESFQKMLRESVRPKRERRENTCVLKLSTSCKNRDFSKDAVRKKQNLAALNESAKSH
jgi:hypothetical protein